MVFRSIYMSHFICYRTRKLIQYKSRLKKQKPGLMFNDVE